MIYIKVVMTNGENETEIVSKSVGPGLAWNILSLLEPKKFQSYTEFVKKWVDDSGEKK